MTSNMIMRIMKEESGQAMTEYILVYATIALAIVGVVAAWKLPLAKYLNAIAQAIAKTR